MKPRIALFLLLGLALSSFAQTPECGRLLLFPDGKKRVQLGTEAGPRLRAALEAAGFSATSASRKIKLSHRLVLQALQGGGTLSESHFQALVGLLLPDMRASFAPVETPTNYALALPLRRGVSVPVSVGQARLLQSYRSNYSGSVADLVSLLRISISLWYKTVAGNARSIPCEVFDKLFFLVRLDRAKWESAAELQPDSDLEVLAAFAGAPGSHPSVEKALKQFRKQVRSWFLSRLQNPQAEASAETLLQIEVLTQKAVNQLPEMDLRRPVSVSLEALLKQASEPAPVPPETKSAAPAPMRPPPARDWDAAFAQLDFAAADSLAPWLSESLVPTRPFRALWRREMEKQKLSGAAQTRLLGIGKVRLANLKADEAFYLTPRELVRLVALLGLPLYPAVRLATEYEAGADDDRVVLTPAFRRVAQAHQQWLKLESAPLSAAMGSTNRNLFYQVVSGLALTLPRHQLKKLIATLQIAPLAGRALLGPGFVCDPAEEFDRCEHISMEIDSKYVPMVQYTDMRHALQDLALLSARLAQPQTDAARQRDSESFRARWFPLVWAGLRSHLHHPKQGRERLAASILQAELHIALQGNLVFHGDLLQALREVVHRTVDQANEPAASAFPAPRFQYD